MLRIILIIVIILVVIKIYNVYYLNNTDTFINITNPFVSGISDVQLKENIPDHSQYLDNPTVFNKNLLTNKKNIINTKNIINNKNRKIYDLYNKSNPSKVNKDIDTLKNMLNNKKQIKISKKLNKFFIQSQFNDAYRDVLTAFNLICPDQKIFFNSQALPVTTTLYDPEKNAPIEVMKLLNQFTSKLNKTILKLPESAEIINDYNNYLPLTSQLPKYTENKGINQFYKEIGVDYNLYPDTPQNSPIEIIKITNMKREYTEYETKYIVSFVIKKILKSIDDQLKITVHFLTKNEPLEADLFEGHVDNLNSIKKVIIEFIFIDGFYTNDFAVDYDCYGNNNPKNNVDGDVDFYSFNALGENTLTSDNDIIKNLNKKLREHEIEMNNFNVNIPYPVYDNLK